MKKRSDLMTQGVERAPHRSLLRAGGFTHRELQNPIIGIANSFNEIIPGHTHLDKLSEAVKAGIYAAGGTPVVFNTIGVCDGIAIIQDGDVIDIDIPGKTLNVQLEAKEIQKRLEVLPVFELKKKTGYLARYAANVSSADKGAVFPL